MDNHNRRGLVHRGVQIIHKPHLRHVSVVNVLRRLLPDIAPAIDRERAIVEEELDIHRAGIRMVLLDLLPLHLPDALRFLFQQHAVLFLQLVDKIQNLLIGPLFCGLYK